MLRVGREVIVTFPNFGHWKHRLQILRGRMPVSDTLPYQWYDTPNVHLCTVADFDAFLAERAAARPRPRRARGRPRGRPACRTCWASSRSTGSGATTRRVRRCAPGARDAIGATRALADPPPRRARRSSNKLFWVGVLYFAEGFPLGVFYEIFPVYFRQQGVELRQIGVLSLLGLAWTLKFLWAPAIDYWRHHRRWMAAVDVGMGIAMLYFAMQAGFGPSVWVAIGVVHDAVGDERRRDRRLHDRALVEGRARVRQRHTHRPVPRRHARVGRLLMASDALGWSGAFVLRRRSSSSALAVGRLVAPRERARSKSARPFAAELATLARSPYALAVLAGFVLGVLWLIDGTTKWSARMPGFWAYAAGGALALAGAGRAGGRVARRLRRRWRPALPTPAGDALDGAPCSAR